jgi:hypothetical protein
MCLQMKQETSTSAEVWAPAVTSSSQRWPCKIFVRATHSWRLRRQLAWEGYPQATPDFHASEELQAVRDRVFEELAKWDFEVDSTIFNKRLTAPELTGDDVGFYRAAWQTHFDKVAPSLFGGGDELLVMGASLGIKKRRQAFHRAIEDVVASHAGTTPFRTVSWSGTSDPCLWVSNFCSWAIQRKWERNDDRSHVLIKHRIRSERLA